MRPAERIVPEHIILIALDGVRRQDVFLGADPTRSSDTRSAEEIAPNLMALARRGIALGAPDGPSLQASGPNYVSLPGYLEMLTGRETRCQENDCQKLPPRTLADALARAPRAGVGAIISSWGAFTVTKRTAAAPARHHRSRQQRDVANAFAQTRKQSNSRKGSATPGHGDYRPDSETISIAMSYLERERPRFMFVSLGDTDELAHHDDYDAYLGALSRADRFIGDVMELSKAWRAKGERTAIFVTTDHGRAKNFRDHGREHPESAEVWLIAGGDGIAPQPEPPFEPQRRLRDVAHTIAVLADIPFESEDGSGSPMAEMLAYDPSQ
jgi:uncharacterized protein (DUF1501 family)